MAIVAGLAIVLVALPAAMFFVHAGLIMFMAQYAFKYFIIGSVDMAGSAALPPATMYARVNTEILPVMIESRWQPGVQGMARSAIMRKVQGHMIGIGRALEIGLMAREAIRGRAREAIIDVALIAGGRSVRPGQRKAGLVVIKGRGQPGARGVTRSAIVRKIRSHMVGVNRALKIRLMTGEAIHGRPSIAIIQVAEIAGHGQIRAGERETRAIMIKARRLPCRVIVAG